MRTRALTRHHAQRIKDKQIRNRKRLLENMDPADVPRYIGKVSHSPKNCSCWMCGNPRRKKVKERDLIADLRHAAPRHEREDDIRAGFEGNA